MKNSKPTSPVNRFLRSLTSLIVAAGAVGANAQQPTTEGEAVVLEEFNVFARSAESAVSEKRESNIVGSFLGSDTLADLPDDDLGEALSRLAGINVIGGGGLDEASVTIRGADGQYNSIRINGAAQANARLGGRTYDLNQIPTEMVSSVQVLKSITAEYPADSIGGSVNVVTATAFSLVDPVSRYKVEARHRDQGDLWGWGGNFVYSNVYSLGGGEKNLGMLLNFNYIDEDIVTWSTQNRFLSTASRLDSNDPNFESFANQTILDVNEDASIPIWDRFDPNERRATRDELTFNASFDFKLGDNSTLFFRPWYQKLNQSDDADASRIDRLERAFDGEWFFLDDDGNALGEWQDSDNDGNLGSEGDTFVNAVDGNGNLIVTPNFEANADGRHDRIVRRREDESETYTLDFGGKTSLEHGDLNYRFMYSQDDGKRYDREWRFQEQFADGRAGDFLRARVTNGSTPLPEFSAFEVTTRRGHVPSNNKEDVFNDANRLFTDTAPRFYDEDIHEDVLLGEIHYDHKFSESFKLKTGLTYRKATRENVVTQLFFAPTAGARRVFPAGQIGVEDGPSTLWDGKYADTFGNFLLAPPMYEFFFDDYAANPGNWEFARSDLRDAADTADLEETISSGYIQGTYRHENLTIIAGVRYEKTKLDTTWKPSNFLVDGNGITGLSSDQAVALNEMIQAGVSDIGFNGPTGGFSFGDIVDNINEKSDYDNLLPSIVGTYRAGNSGHVFRFAWTNTLTRPDYRELVPFDLGEANRQLQAAGVLNLTNRDEEFDLGNPGLHEQTSENWDLAWEYYFGPEKRNTVSVTLFKKDLQDFLQQDIFQRDIEVLVDPDDPSLGTEFVRADAAFWSNAAEASIEGVEFSGYFNFESLLPGMGLLRGLSFVPNYTYITGDQTNPVYDPDELDNGNFVVIDQIKTDSLTNQAEHILNLQLFYEKPRFNVRLSYNFISELQRTPSTAAISARTFDRAQSSWDLSAQYRLSKDSDLRLFVEIDNLTNQPQDERFIGKQAGLYTTSYETLGRRYVFGIRGSF